METENALALLSARFGVSIKQTLENPPTFELESKEGPDGKLSCKLEVTEAGKDDVVGELMVAIECMQKTAMAKYGLTS